MGNVFYFDWEVELMVAIQTIACDFLTILAKLFTLLGDEYLMIIILGLFYWSINKEIGKKIALCVCTSMMAGTLIKGLVLRRRPYMDNSEIECLRAAHPDEDIMNPKLQGYSCPSLHSAMSLSVGGTIFKNTLNKVLKIICIIVPICIGLSRIYLGVHYPTDVLLGWIIGLLAILFMSLILKKFNYKVGFLIILVISLLGFIYCHDIEFYTGYGVTLGLLLGFIYEEKYVNFSSSKRWWSYILRPILGVIIFIIVNTLLKLPVAGISGEGILILLYRLFRYTFTTFIIIGLYPHLFKKFKI